MTLLLVITSISIPLVGIGMALAYIVLYKPEYFVILLYRVERYRAGLVERTVISKGFCWSYVERGVPNPRIPSMLFLHGLSSRKESWAGLVQMLPKDVHLVIPDLPGHGETDRMVLDENTFQRFADKVYEFVVALRMDQRKLHLVGLSIGGAIALRFALTYPNMVAGVTANCPSMKTPVKSKMNEQMEKGETPVLIDYSISGLRKLLDMMTYKKIYVPEFILRASLKMRNKHKDDHTKLFNLIASTPQSEFDSLANKVTTPTQVIWGMNDELLHVSGAGVLKKKLPNVVECHLLDKCGHAIDMEKPAKLASLLVDFSRNHLQ